jgi:hypothetical protein
VRTILFEAYDEPWKGSSDSSNSEGCFGIWQAEGTSAAQNQYTLTGETLKYPLRWPGRARHPQKTWRR